VPSRRSTEEKTIRSVFGKTTAGAKEAGADLDREQDIRKRPRKRKSKHLPIVVRVEKKRTNIKKRLGRKIKFFESPIEAGIWAHGRERKRGGSERGKVKNHTPPISK